MTGRLARLAVAAVRPSAGLRPRPVAMFETPPAAEIDALDGPRAGVTEAGPPPAEPPRSPPTRTPAAASRRHEEAVADAAGTPSRSGEGVPASATAAVTPLRGRGQEPRAEPAAAERPQVPAVRSPEIPRLRPARHPVATAIGGATGDAVPPAPSDPPGQRGADRPPPEPLRLLPGTQQPDEHREPLPRLHPEPPPARDRTRVTVTIGRIEVAPEPAPQAREPTTPRRTEPRRATSAPRLGDYLRDRSRR
jgi:hypothetical protein